jgi:hypothetical protein
MGGQHTGDSLAAVGRKLHADRRGEQVRPSGASISAPPCSFGDHQLACAAGAREWPDKVTTSEQLASWRRPHRRRAQSDDWRSSAASRIGRFSADAGRERSYTRRRGSGRGRRVACSGARARAVWIAAAATGRRPHLMPHNNDLSQLGRSPGGPSLRNGPAAPRGRLSRADDKCAARPIRRHNGAGRSASHCVRASVAAAAAAAALGSGRRVAPLVV